MRRRLREYCATRAAWLIAACACACGAPPARSRTPAPTPSPRLHQGPLSDLIPAASLRWLALVKPGELLGHPELGPALRQVLTERRLDAFTEASGVDLRRVPKAAVAGFPYATVYLAEVPADMAESARERFTERLVAGATTKRPRPNLTRITGVVGQTPETLLTVEDHALAVTVGDPLYAKIAEAYAEERLKTSPSALRGSALKALPPLDAENPIVLLAPGPFADEWRSAALGLLESTVAIGVSIRPIGHDKIAATVSLAGGWGNEADAAARRLATAWTSFTQSSAGHLFQLNPNAVVESTPELLTLRVELDIEPLARGLKAAVFSDIGDLMRAPSDARSNAPRDAPSRAP